MNCRVYTDKSTLVMSEKHIVNCVTTFRYVYTITTNMIRAIEGTTAWTYLHEDVQVYGDARIIKGYVEVYTAKCSNTAMLESLLQDLAQLAMTGVLDVTAYPTDNVSSAIRYTVKPKEVLKFQVGYDDWELVKRL